MKAIAKTLDWDDIPVDVQSFISEKQTFLTPEQEYIIYAVSVYKSVPFFLVVDDLEMPVFLPTFIFSVIANEPWSGWICNVNLGAEVELVLGPDFIARDLGAYVAMIDQETPALDSFWRYRSEVQRTIDR
jgi:hypothetical protein